MNGELRRQVHESMRARETDELLGIWQQNDRTQWSDEAFDAIRELLLQRGVALPTQGEPIYEHDEDKEIDRDEFSDEELKIIDDENPPEFYDPFEVLRLGRWLRIAAAASVAIALLLGISQYRSYFNVAWSYFHAMPAGQYLAPLVAIAVLLLGVALQIVITYFPLRALAHILRILMEMEFNSRATSDASR